MQGNFDAPPIILRSSRWKALLGLSGSLLFGLVSTLAILDIRSDGTPAIDVWALYVTAGICALAAPILLVLAIRPNTMTVSPGGVTIRGLFQQYVYRWEQLSNIETMRISWVLFATAEVAGGEGRVHYGAIAGALAGC